MPKLIRTKNRSNVLFNNGIQRKRRHIEDVPFYKLKHGYDDLPLDPVRPYILEKIQKFRSTKPSEFANDLNLHSFTTNEMFSENFPSDNIVPRKIEKKSSKHKKSDTEYDESVASILSGSWLVSKEFEVPSKHRMFTITNEVIHIWKEERQRKFQRNVEVLLKLRAKKPRMKRNGTAIRRKHRATGDHTRYNTPSSFQSQRQWKNIFTYNPGDEFKFREPSERQREIERMGKLIDDLITWHEEDVRMATHSNEKKCGTETMETDARTDFTPSPSTTSQVNRQMKRRKKSISNEEFLIGLKNQEKLIYQYMQCLQPVDPDEQKEKILQKYENEYKIASAKFSTDIQRKMINLLKNISVMAIETYPTKLILKTFSQTTIASGFLKAVYKYVKQEQILWPEIKSEIIIFDFLFNPNTKRGNIKESEAIMLAALLLDLQEDYRYHVKRAMLKFILRSKDQRARLQMENEPPDFPLLTIKGPVSWKCNIQIAYSRLDQVLMVNHPVLQAINGLWYQLYKDFIVFDTSKCYRDQNPLHFDVITDIIHNSCLVARDILMNDWLPRVARLVFVMFDFWKDLSPVPIRPLPSIGRAGILFRCIHALMSYQVQGLLKRSLDHLYDTIEVYKDGNLIDKYDLNHPKLKRRPFMTLNISVVGKFHENSDDLCDKTDSVLYQTDEDDPSILPTDSPCKLTEMKDESVFVLTECGKMFLEPYMEKLPSLFVSYFKSILKVGYDIPRLEYYMSHDESQRGFLHCIPETHIDMIKLYQQVENIVIANQTGPTTYLYPIYTYYFPLISDQIKKLTERIFEQDTIPALPTFIQLMEKLNAVIDESFYQMDYVPLNLFMLDCRRINHVLFELVREVKDFVTDYFKALNQKDNRRICDEFEEMSMHAGERPKETAEVVALQNYLTECRDERIFKLKDEIKKAAERVVFLLHHATLDAEEIYLNSRTFLWPHELEQVLELSAARLSVVRENLEVALKERRIKFETYLINERKKMEMFRLRETKEFLSIDELKEKCDTMDVFMEILKKCEIEGNAINVDENLLQLEVTAFPTLLDMIEKMEPIEKLWKTAYKFDKCHESWYYGPFLNLNGEQIRQDVESMYTTIQKLIKQLANNLQAKRIAEQVRLKIDKFKIYLPILDAICQQGLSERHWNLISEELGQVVNPDMYSTLCSMIEIDILRIANRLEEIAYAAAKEYELNVQLTDMKEEWTEVMFDMKQYRDSDVKILAILDDVQALLDDHILKSQSMRGSPFIMALGKKATDWEEKLINMQDIMDIWVQVQSTWMYLEPIFSSEDIMRQMPVEGRNFKAVDRTWRQIMKSTYDDRRVIQATDYPDLLNILRTAFAELEGVQKGLNTYLEKKRLFLPRFFFLSNDEILEILSETKDPTRVQPHLRKCFQGIHSLEFDPNGEITAILSAEKESLLLTKKINPTAANGLVEKWLKEVQTIMLESMLTQTRMAYDSYWNAIRKDWMTKWPGQVVQTVTRMTWTKEIEDAIFGNALITCQTKYTNYLENIVNQIRGDGDLSMGLIITLQALILLDIHGCDILQYLIDTNTVDIKAFNWAVQLRYYWKYDDIDKTDIVSVCMLSTDVRYGMEYLGNISRLVVTPQSDRCYRTMMNAIKLNLSTAMDGPSGAGKADTCMDLAKAVGKKYLVFNCSNGMDYKVLGKFFKGLIQSGAWVILGQFDRIELQVLSVVAQQISLIQRAIASNTVKLLFEETTLKLDPTCNIMVTMCTEYSAGRYDFPDNLKLLFRKVGMTIPDFRNICELSFYSAGFQDSQQLSRTISIFHRICSEQLSYQHHYEFGIRSLKNALSIAASLRRNNSQLTEQQILLKSLLDLHVSKLVENDIPHFERICSELFAGIEIPRTDTEYLENAIRVRLEKKKLQPTPWLMRKILQLYHLVCLKHSIMLVGGTMVGKTTAWQTLAETLKDIKNDEQAKIKELEVTCRIINPKSVSDGHLFGRFDVESGEWMDGVLAKTFREMATSTLDIRSWIIFDGTVDPMWVEKLNTLLDDNRKLCLTSGEMIEKSKSLTILFETVDLEQASPATVSRCGFVYMDQHGLGWEVVHKSFLIDLEALGLNEIYISLYETLVDWLIPAVVEMLRNLPSIIAVTAMYQYKIFTQFFIYFLENRKQYNQIWFQQVFLYCMAWSYAATLNGDNKRQLDSQLRKLLNGNIEERPKPKLFTLNRGQMFPEKMCFMDYRFDEVDTWWPWTKTEDISIPPDTPIGDILIPTKETKYISTWMNVCTAKSIPVLLVGATGTGKTATVMNFLRELPKEKYLFNVISFSARMTAQQLQEIIMSKLDRRRKGVFGPPVGKSCMIFVDDVAVPARDLYGSQPPLELLRQWLNHGYWSDLKDTSKVELVDLISVGATGNIGGRNYIYPRFYRHSYILALDVPDSANLLKIFSTIMDWHFAKGFVDKVVVAGKAIASAICEIYAKVSSLFLPVPKKPHYLFSIRDIANVVQGIVLVPPKKLTIPEKLIRLWAHENYRVFSDRLSTAEDKTEFFKLIQNESKASLKIDLGKALGKHIPQGVQLTDECMRGLMFGNYMEPDADPRVYDEVDSMTKAERIMNYYLNEFNGKSKTPLNMVLFRFAIEHISRVSRALHMRHGNMLLVGLGGSGRRCAIRLAASINDCDLFHVEVKGNYDFQQWRQDIRKVLMHTGMQSKRTVFMFWDTQAIDEAFIDDISTLITSGDLPNLYQPEEKVTILESMHNFAKQEDLKIDMTPLSLYGLFIDRLRENLHFALAFSPIGHKFKRCLQIYPALITYCTLDWFSEWPDDALQHVAKKFIISMNLSMSTMANSNAEQLEMKTSGDVVATDDDDTEDTNNVQLSDLEQNLVDIVIYFNQSVRDCSQRYFVELGRWNYVTPASLLQMLQTFSLLYIKKNNEITVKRDRYTTGLEKLDSAAGQVGDMQQKLFDLQPKLRQLSDETEKIMVEIERDTAEAEKKKEVVGADEAAANEAAAAAQAIKDDCDGDLQEAIPAFNAALAALNTLKPPDITIVKSMKNPPAAVKLVLEAVCIIRGIKPERKADATGKVIEDYWAPSLKMLSDLKFLDNLKSFDKDNIPAPTIKRIRDKYISDRDFVPDKVKNVSTACEGLCKWVRAMDIYDRVAKIVAPKQQALAAAEAELADQMEKLNAKRAELQIILDKLQGLNDYFAEKSKQKKNLEDEIDNCEKKLDRAETLLGGLGGEKSRWSEIAMKLNNSLVNVVGDVLIAAACIAYLGCFNVKFRNTTLTNWNKRCVEMAIPCTPIFLLSQTLGDVMQIRDWTLCGLPSDQFFIENAIIVKNTGRYPLMIDPQGLANKWVKRMEAENELKVIKLTDDDYTKVIENAITYGYPVLLENIGETIDSGLHSILERNVVKQKGMAYVKCGDDLISYNENFWFYITTCLKNPHYGPETVSMVTLLNCMVTDDGLKEQLLATVVVQDRPDLQEKKEKLIVESAKNRDSLYALESKILEVLSLSEGNILEDENAINILSSSKALSEEIQAKQIVAISTEKEIDEARQKYYPVAQYSAVLFFCINEMGNVCVMYEYSLQWFLDLFISTIMNTPKGDNLQERLAKLNACFTKSIYENVSRTLYQRDKIIFSFVMCLGILRLKENINDEQVIFLLRGNASTLDVSENTASDWLSDNSWALIQSASKLPGLEGFADSIAKEPSTWKIFYESSEPENLMFPHPLENITDLRYLIILKCLRRDRLLAAIELFVARNLGSEFTEVIPFELSTVLDNTPSSMLFIFLLSPGSNPLSHIFKLAEEKGMLEKLRIMSMGQRQGARASKLITDSLLQGNWVIIENCHTDDPWLGELEVICQNIQVSENVNEDFRLWLTAYPTDHFPITILQMALKVVVEQSHTLKTTMTHMFTTQPWMDNTINHCTFVGGLEQQWYKSVFSLVFFHAVVQERKTFGSIGWNVPYDFNDTDLKISLVQLKMFMNLLETIPLEGISSLIVDCNYGGRITDENDRYLINVLLKEIYNQTVLEQEEFTFIEFGEISMPAIPTNLNNLDIVSKLPHRTNPELVGLGSGSLYNKNCDEATQVITSLSFTQADLLATILLPNDINKNEDQVLKLCQDILNALPEPFDVNEHSTNPTVPTSENTIDILNQELLRYNNLLECIKLTLNEVSNAILGHVFMIPRLDQINMALSIDKIPHEWTMKSYPSKKSLGSYMKDLLQRIAFLRKWIEKGEPCIYWFPAFFFPQAFVMSKKRAYSRNCNTIDLDMVKHQFVVTQFDRYTHDVAELEFAFKPTINAVSFDGIFLEGGRWNRQASHLDESNPKEQFDKLPIITMLFVPAKEAIRTNEYQAPLYKTSQRCGCHTNTSHSTNFVMNIGLKTIKPIHHWTIRGLAALCQPND